jgi:hypothetical protein
VIVLLALALAASQDGPSFDCARAETPVEQAICADPEWSRLDRRMAERYVAVRRTLTGPAREALTRDQRWFLGAQEEWFENRERWTGFPEVPDRLADRAEFLASIRPGRPTSLAGRWRNVAGVVEITQSAPGRLSVTIDAASPVNARWLCEGVGFEGPLSGRTVEGIGPGDPAYRIRAVLRDGYLEIEEGPVGEAAYSPPYCGANGRVAGPYFRVN